MADRTLTVVFAGDASRAVAAAGAVDSAMGSLSTRLSAVGSKFTTFGRRMSIGVTLPLLYLGKTAFTAASDVNESMNKVQVVFGETAKSVVNFSKDSANALGISQQAALESAGTFGNLFTAMKLGEEESARMSIGLVQLASDLASFNNTDPEEALMALRSGLVGEIEPLRRFGVQLSAARVEQVALNRGLAESASELTDAQKAMVRYDIIMQDTTTAQGDFARTADGAANKQRILTARAKDTAATLGKKLLPIGQKILDWALRLATAFGELTPQAQNLALAIAGVAAAIGPLATVLGGLIKLVAILLTPVGAVTAAIIAVGVAFVVAYKKSEAFRNVVDSVGRFLRDNVLPAIKEVARGIANTWADLVAWTKQHWKQIEHVVNIVVTTIKAIWDVVGPTLVAAVRAVWETIRNVIKTIAGVIQGIVETFLAILSGDWKAAWEGIKQVLHSIWEGIKGIVKAAVDFIIAQIARLLGPLQSLLDKLDAVGGTGAGIDWDNFDFKPPPGPNSTPGLSSGQGVGGTTINVYAYHGVSREEVKRAAKDAIREAERNGARVNRTALSFG